jgi:hypothetical protein
MFVFMVFGNMKIYYQNKTTKKGEFWKLFQNISNTRNGNNRKLTCLYIYYDSLTKRMTSGIYTNYLKWITCMHECKP